MTKLFSFLFGLVAYGLTFLIRFMPGMLEAAIVIGGVVNGPILAVFSLGMLFPWVNWKGVLAGFFSSILVTVWIATGGSIYKHFNPYISRTSPAFPSNISDCPAEWLSDYKPTISAEPTPLAGHLDIYDISYVWYTTIGLSVNVIVSLIMSLFTSQDLRLLDKNLLAPSLPKLWSWLPTVFSSQINQWWFYVGIDRPKDGLELKKLGNLC